MDLYEIVEQYLQDAKSGMLATVVYRAGSAPREVGAKMFIGGDGKTYGTVGGGRLESDACLEASRIMQKGEARMLHFRMDGREVAAEGMLCGGDVDILLEPVSVKYRDVYNSISEHEKKGKKGLVITKCIQNVVSKSFIDNNLKVTGDVLSDEEISSFEGYMRGTKLVFHDGILIEPLIALPVLYIFGAGHVSQYIAKIAKMVDFYVVVIDDRDEFANRERFPEANEVIVKDFDQIFNIVNFNGTEFVVIVTRGHAYDADVLRETLKRQTRYVGMIGSRRKVKIVFDYMRKCGFDEKTIEKVHAPVGLSIHAETPQEIAVSIVAQLIQVRGEN